MCPKPDSRIKTKAVKLSPAMATLYEREVKNLGMGVSTHLALPVETWLQTKEEQTANRENVR